MAATIKVNQAPVIAKKKKVVFQLQQDQINIFNKIISFQISPTSMVSDSQVTSMLINSFVNKLLRQGKEMLFISTGKLNSNRTFNGSVGQGSETRLGRFEVIIV